jgi:hypothetical protein
MYQIAYGTNSASQSQNAIQSPVEISIAQLLPVVLDYARVILSTRRRSNALEVQGAVLPELMRLGSAT